MRFLSLLIFFIVCGMVVGVANAQNELAVVHVGNSHSHPLRLLEPLSQQTEHPYRGGEINILGAPLGWNCDHGEQNKWAKALAIEKKWDVITLLSWGNKNFGTVIISPVERNPAP